MPEFSPVKDIPYTLIDGKQHYARIIPVHVSLEGLDQNELQIIGHLAEAANSITPIFARQSYDNILEIVAALQKAEKNLEGKEKEAIAAYNLLFAVRNGIWEYKGDQSFQFPLPKEKAEKYIPSKIVDILFHKEKAPKGRALYPEDMAEEEFEALGEDKNKVNSSIVRDQEKKARVIVHEERYKKEVEKILEPLKKAFEDAKDKKFKEYLGAKIKELRVGSEKSRGDANRAWMRVDGRIDLSLSTGVETYLDRFKGVRGVAQAGVFLERGEYRDLCQQVLGMLQELEDKAPWNAKKKINLANAPRLRFVDVVAWGGFYETFPGAVIAQSLPNEKEFKDKYGSVNFVFANIQEAMGKWGAGDLLKKEFFTDEDMKKYKEMMITAHLKLTAFHEIGHTMGGVEIAEEPSVFFGAEYSLLEEARAEVISLWMLPHLVRKGILKAEEENAGYYSMLLSLLGAMRLKPVDHTGSRNMMFYYFLKHGAIQEKKVEGKSKFGVQPEKMRKAVEEMLAELGNMKSRGDKEALKKFEKEYLKTDRQEEFQERLKHAPLGGGFIFPTIIKKEGKYTNEVTYPQEFRDQSRALNNFTKK